MKAIWCFLGRNTVTHCTVGANTEVWVQGQLESFSLLLRCSCGSLFYLKFDEILEHEVQFSSTNSLFDVSFPKHTGIVILELYFLMILVCGLCIENRKHFSVPDSF